MQKEIKQRIDVLQSRIDFGGDISQKTQDDLDFLKKLYVAMFVD